MMDVQDLVFEFESDCESFAADIRKKICKSILRTLNKTMTGQDGDDYDSVGMSYVDKISIKYQSCSLEEISYGFEDGLWEMIDAEYNALSPQDRHFLDYSKCSENNEIDIEGIKNEILSDLCKMIDEHYYTKKVQRYVDKYDWI